MTFKGMISAAAVFGLATASVAAQAAGVDRATAPVEDGNAMGGGGRAIAPIFAILAFVAFLLASASEDEPSSP